MTKRLPNAYQGVKGLKMSAAQGEYVYYTYFPTKILQHAYCEKEIEVEGILLFFS
jgi:hypothetical protein